MAGGEPDGECPYIKLVRRNVVESTGIRLEILGQNADRVAQESLGDQEGRVLAEVALVEDQEELAALVKCLNAVRHSGWEEPNIAGTDVVDEGRALLIDSRHSHTAFQHQRPLVGRVPVQLAVRMRAQSHVHAGHGFGGGEVFRVLLPRPARARVGSGSVVRQAQRPHGSGHIAGVGAGRCVDVGVQALVVVGARARVGGTVAPSDGLWRIDAVEVQVEAQLLAGGLAVDVLGVRDDCRVGCVGVRERGRTT